MTSDEALKQELDEIMECYVYIHATDIFLTFYNRRMVRRIILNLSYSLELEQKIIESIRMYAGDDKVLKSEEILKEIQNSKVQNKEFEKHLVRYRSERGKTSDAKISYINPSDIRIVVLPENFWPFQNDRLPVRFEPVTASELRSLRMPPDAGLLSIFLTL